MRLHRLLLLGLPLASLPAQTILRVGPTQTFATIQAAVDAAAGGEVVIVDPGSYPTFTVTKTLTIRADPQGSVTTGAAAFTQNGLVVLDGLVMQSCSVGSILSTNVSTTSLFDCQMQDGLWIDNASASLTRCTSLSTQFGPAAQLNRSANLAAVQSTFRCLLPFFASTDGMTLTGTSTAHLSNCTVEAGDTGALHQTLPGIGLRVRDQSRAWLVDCTVTGNTGRPAIDNLSPLPVVIDNCTLSTGTFPGQVTTGLVQNGFVLGASSSTGLALGQSFAMQFRSRPGLPVVVHLSLQLASPNQLPVLAEPEWGFAAGSVAFALMIADAQGVAATGIAIPANPRFLNTAVWFAAWSELGLPLQITPPFGGVIH